MDRATTSLASTSSPYPSSSSRPVPSRPVPPARERTTDRPGDVDDATTDDATTRRRDDRRPTTRRRDATRRTTDATNARTERLALSPGPLGAEEDVEASIGDVRSIGRVESIESSRVESIESIGTA